MANREEYGIIMTVGLAVGLVHLTYSTQQSQGSARGIEFRTTEEVKEYMEQRYIEEYL